MLKPGRNVRARVTAGRDATSTGRRSGISLGFTFEMTACDALMVSPFPRRTPIALPPDTRISSTRAPQRTSPPFSVMTPTRPSIIVEAPPLPMTMPKSWPPIVSRNEKSAPPEISGAKSKCMPHEAMSAFTLGEVKCSSVNARVEVKASFTRSYTPSVPSARCADHRVLTAFHDGRSEPRMPKRYGARSCSFAVSTSHSATSAGDVRSTFARVAAASASTPSIVPSGKTEQNGFADGTSSKP
ncbi:unannotated protein [freshwater metagenome]|uniref:Unannotated protein n=1 Tax=freshwater metagenome TaxID=449393 RepID=A0A6J7LZG2_9ZZZZ